MLPTFLSKQGDITSFLPVSLRFKITGDVLVLKIPFLKMDRKLFVVFFN